MEPWDAGMTTVVGARISEYQKAKTLPFTIPHSKIQILLKLHYSKIFVETVEKPASKELMENVQMQGFRNPEE